MANRPPNSTDWDKFTTTQQAWGDIPKGSPRVRYEPDGCWVWTQSCRGTGGYGRVYWDGIAGLAHRVSFTLATGVTIPPGAVVCHHCDNPPCVNPAHLFLGTTLMNVRDKIAKGRDSHTFTGINRAKTHCLRGHEFTVENTGWSAKGRNCKACHKSRDDDRYALTSLATKALGLTQKEYRATYGQSAETARLIIEGQAA